MNQKLRLLNSLRPLPKGAVKKLREQFELEMTYNSNAIEGNSLTLKETYWVIHEGLTIKGKPFRDHLEAKDHHAALGFLYELISDESQPTLSEHLIKTLHHLVVKKSEEEFAGKYRTSNVVIGGSDHVPPDALQVPQKMEGLMKWFAEKQKILHPVELAAIFHHKLVHLHPFLDGNGRTARLVMNVILLKASYPLTIVLKNDRRKYYRVLNKADQREYEPLVKFVAQTVERSLDIYLQALQPTNDPKKKFRLLSKISQKVPYSAKYLNLLARTGKLAAHKKGRNWVTSVEEVEKYRQNRKRKV
ncbi:MAG: Fic family protein [Patescibacteria group bacterium]|nr:Fic family protein [Patescibacteria group bacterium]